MKFFKSIFKDPQNIIAIGVSIISLCALGVSFMQTQIMKEEHELVREYSRASVWPYIEIASGRAFNTDRSIKTFVIAITNNGVGPAKITDVKITYNGKAATSWGKLFDLMKIPDTIERVVTNRPFNKKVIKIGEQFQILNLNDNLPLAEIFYKNFEDISFEIYYESIYKEKWKYDGEQTIKLDDFQGLQEKNQFN